MKSSVIVVRVSPSEKCQFQDQAEKHKVSLSTWIICHLLEACEKGGDIGKPTSEPVKADTPVNIPKAQSYGKCLYCWSTETTLKTIQGVGYPVCAKHISKT